MKTHIFIKTYPKDFVWLEWCLKSIQKFCSGFTGVSIVCDREGDGSFPVGVVSGMQDVQIFYVDRPRSCEGYLFQQAVKLKALDYCPHGTEAVLYVDSDVIFFEKTTPESFLSDDGRVVLLKESYSSLLQHPENKGVAAWQRSTHVAVGIRPVSEYMRRMPLLFSAHTLVHIGSRYGHWVPSIVTGKWKEFSEFNAIGFVAELNEVSVARSGSGVLLYDIRDVEQGGSLPLCAKQYWSWGGLQEQHLAEIKGFLECE